MELARHEKDPQSPGPCPEATHTERRCQAWCLWLWPGSKALTTIQAHSPVQGVGTNSGPETASTGNGSDPSGDAELQTALFVWWEVLGPLGPGGECWDMGRLGHGTFDIKSILGRRVRSLTGLRCPGLHWAVVAVERS